MRRLLPMVLLAPWLLDPHFGARRDAYGPGVHRDATGRPYYDAQPGHGRVVVPPGSAFDWQGYGPGIGRDVYGRPIVPEWNDEEPEE